MDVPLILDLMLTALLGVTIVYAMVLNRRLRRLREGESEMRSLIEGFNSATEQAQRNLAQMSAMAKDAARGPANPNWASVQERLNQDIDKAQSLRDDLAYMLERAEHMADRMEGAAASARTPKIGAKTHSSPAGNASEPRSAAERELIRALRAQG